MILPFKGGKRKLRKLIESRIQKHSVTISIKNPQNQSQSEWILTCQSQWYGNRALQRVHSIATPLRALPHHCCQHSRGDGPLVPTGSSETLPHPLNTVMCFICGVSAKLHWSFIFCCFVLVYSCILVCVFVRFVYVWVWVFVKLHVCASACWRSASLCTFDFVQIWLLKRVWLSFYITDIHVFLGRSFSVSFFFVWVPNQLRKEVTVLEAILCYEGGHPEYCSMSSRVHVVVTWVNGWILATDCHPKSRGILWSSLVLFIPRQRFWCASSMKNSTPNVSLRLWNGWRLRSYVRLPTTMTYPILIAQNCHISPVPAQVLLSKAIRPKRASTNRSSSGRQSQDHPDRTKIQKEHLPTP